MSSPSPERYEQLAAVFQNSEKLTAGGPRSVLPLDYRDEAVAAFRLLARVERLMREPGFCVNAAGSNAFTAAVWATRFGDKSRWETAPTAWEAVCKLADALEATDD